MVLPSERDGPDGAFDGIIVEVDPAVIEEAAERRPAGECVSASNRGLALPTTIEATPTSASSSTARPSQTMTRPSASTHRMPTPVLIAASFISMSTRIEAGQLRIIAPPTSCNLAIANTKPNYVR